MTTNFFQALYNLYPVGNWQIAIKCLDNGEMIVSAMLLNLQEADAAGKKVPPLTFRNRPEVFDEQFFTALATPIEKIKGLVLNLQEYEKATEAARAATKMEQDKQAKEKKEKTDRVSKFEAQMKKVKELEEQKKFGEAIGQLPKVADFPDHEAEIKKRKDELYAQHGQLSLL